MQRSFLVSTDVETTRNTFVLHLVKRGPGSIGKEAGVAGFVDARRRFALAIQGWEHNLWIRPFLTRLEGHFERSPQNDYTRVAFETRGLTIPLTFISLLIPYTVVRTLVPQWEGVELALSDIMLLFFSFLVVPLVGMLLFYVENRTHRLLIKALLAVYGDPPLEKR